MTHYFDRKWTILALQIPHIEWNSNLHWKEMACKLVQKILEIFSWLWCGNVFPNRTYEKTPFNSSLVAGNLLFTNSNLELSSKRDDLQGLKLFYLNQLQWTIVIKICDLFLSFQWSLSIWPFQWTSIFKILQCEERCIIPMMMTHWNWFR